MEAPGVLQLEQRGLHDIKSHVGEAKGGHKSLLSDIDEDALPVLLMSDTDDEEKGDEECEKDEDFSRDDNDSE